MWRPDEAVRDIEGSMENGYYAVIMAGGGGTRLWPLSRQAHPKQMLELFGDQSLFQIAVNRLEGLFPLERILVVTVEEQAAALKEECPDLPEGNFLLEPAPRGTASVVGLAATVLARRDPEAVMAVLTADHFIPNVDRFQAILKDAREVAADGHLVTLGIEPTYPASGYGYIRIGSPLEGYAGIDAHEVVRFVEKPDRERAREMVSGGDHAWNSGMFVWRVDRILEEIDRQMPALADGLEEIAAALDTPQREETLARVWKGLEKETVDYGIMEGARNVAVLPAQGLGWSDVGSWDSIFELLPEDEHGNVVVRGEHLGIDSRGLLVYDGRNHELVVTIGLEDVVVVDTGDVLLVCRRDRAQEVRTVVRELDDSEHEHLL